MKTPHRAHAVLALLLVAAAGCKGEAEVTQEVAAGAQAEVGAEATVGADAFIEEHEGGSVAWNIGADGNVKAQVSGPDAKAIRENVSGTLEWKTAADAEAKTVPLELDAKTGLLVAAGPKLEADLTEINYKLTVSSKPWTGALHVPVGGTASLVAGAKAAAEIDVPSGKIGPNGGVIQVVGKDRLEIVADDVTSEVRVYVLDADFNAVAVGERTISLGVVAGAPRVVALAAADGGAYFTGKWGFDVDPTRVTIAVRSAGATACALVGYRPGVRVVVGAKAPTFKVKTKTKWAAHVDGDADADLDAKLKGGKVKVDIDAPDVHGKANASANAKANANANAKLDVKAPSVKVKIEPPKIKPPKVSAKASAGASIKFK
jgi:hypothetical protein